MNWELLKNKKLPFSRRAKNLLFYISRKRGAEKSWQKRHSKIFEKNSDYTKPCSAEVEKEHKQIWSSFRRTVNPETLRICNNISGKADSMIVPEEIFVSDIEPTLNCKSSVNYLSVKSFYNRWFGEGIFPKDFFHNIQRRYYDENLHPITWNKVQSLINELDYPVVFKPNMESYGGEGIHFVKNSESLLDLAKTNTNFVVQEKLEQHNFFSKYNPHGLNTIRVYVYRSVSDDKLYVLTKALRMGRGGSLDNETAGGIHTMIHPDGHMNGYAVDKLGIKYSKHPDTLQEFNDVIPDNTKLETLVKKVTEQVFLARIIGLDACYDDKGNWKIIEINTQGHTVRFSQYGGKPFFGEFTEEVIEYSKENHWALKN